MGLSDDDPLFFSSDQAAWPGSKLDGRARTRTSSRSATMNLSNVCTTCPNVARRHITHRARMLRQADIAGPETKFLGGLARHWNVSPLAQVPMELACWSRTAS